MSGVQKPGERQWLPLESNPDVVTGFSHRIGASRLWKVPAPHAPSPTLRTDCRARRTWPVPRRLRHRPGAAGLCADPCARGGGPLTPSPTCTPTCCVAAVAARRDSPCGALLQVILLFPVTPVSKQTSAGFLLLPLLLRGALPCQ